MEDDFYGTIKFKNGEEIFARVAASEEETRTLLIVHNPVIISEVKGKRGGVVGYKVEPWLKTTTEDMFIVDLKDVLTLSESQDVEMIVMHQRYLRDSQFDEMNKSKINRKMGYLGNVSDTKEILEKLFKKS